MLLSPPLLAHRPKVCFHPPAPEPSAAAPSKSVVDADAAAGAAAAAAGVEQAAQGFTAALARWLRIEVGAAE